MSTLGDLAGKVGIGGGTGGGLLNLAVTIFIGMLGLTIIILIIWYFFFKRKSWNLGVEFKFPRGLNDVPPGQVLDIDEIRGFTSAEWGKGNYDTKRGVVLLKRSGKKPVPMKPFDVKRYLQGTKILTVVQIGADEYLPVLPESFIGVVNEKGEHAVFLRGKTESSSDKSWKNSVERDSKATYSLRNLLAEYAPYIGTGLILLMNFIGFAILYNRIK